MSPLPFTIILLQYRTKDTSVNRVITVRLINNENNGKLLTLKIVFTQKFFWVCLLSFFQTLGAGGGCIALDLVFNKN